MAPSNPMSGESPSSRSSSTPPSCSQGSKSESSATSDQSSDHEVKQEADFEVQAAESIERSSDDHFADNTSVFEGRGTAKSDATTFARPQSWDPGALLNPKGGGALRVSNSSPNFNARPAKPANVPAFQFSSPASAHDDATIPRAASLDHLPQDSKPRNFNGAASLFERNHNLQDRVNAPSPKRRKTEHESDEDEKKPTFSRGGNGVFGEYVRQKQKEGAQAQANTMPLSVEAIDLTDEIDIIDLEADEDDEDSEEVCFGMVEGAMVKCHIVPRPKPGMQAIAGPGYWPQVKVVLRRQHKDSNSIIPVKDYTGEHVGNVAAKVAGALVPLLDANRIAMRTDCLIPSRRRIEGEVQGEPVSREYKLQLMLYGRRGSAHTVGKILKRSGLNLVSPPRVLPGIKVLNPLAREYMLAKEKTGDLAEERIRRERQTEALYAKAMTVRTVEEVRTDVMNVFDSLTESDQLPDLDLPPDCAITTPLLKHQKQALFFMNQREQPLDPEQEQTLWRMQLGNSGEKLWRHVITDQVTRKLPNKTQGGILADMMGLGKTLSILALIAYTKEERLEWAEQNPAQPPPAAKSSARSKSDIPRSEALEMTPVEHNAKTTLIVCPLSTITNWEEQIRAHTRGGDIDWHVYHGPDRIKDFNRLKRFDIVLTTYTTLKQELNDYNKAKTDEQPPLERLAWFRLVLDEAHIIREQNTLQFKAIVRLPAARRWAVTGTPIQNKLDDFAALLAFLRVKPFDDKAKFTEFINTPFKMTDPEIVPKLRILVDTITLRRLKDKINLPLRDEKVERLDFSPDERKIYDIFEKNAQSKLQILTGHQDRLRGRQYIHILQAILRLRRICAHGKDLLSEEDMDVIKGATEESAIDLEEEGGSMGMLTEADAYAAYDLLLESDRVACEWCGRRLGRESISDADTERQSDLLGYMTQCFHLFCDRCIVHFEDGETGASPQNKARGTCPICNAEVSFACVKLSIEKAEANHEKSAKKKRGGKYQSKANLAGYTGPHTKTKHLIQCLLENQAKSKLDTDAPPYKSVVFSGWTSHLDLIELALKDNNIGFVRLDGSMPRIARTAAMNQFRGNDKIEVILVSIMAGGLGLNLTAGNSVFVMEPQYNPAAEAQAVDRVHRLGQERPVTIIRYIMKDSFEEKMEEVQRKKTALAQLSMDRGNRDVVLDKTANAKQKLQELQSLFK